jgi:hypothetical protein
MSILESRAQELYRLLGPRFTILVACNRAVCGIGVRCEDAIYALRF